MKNMYLLLIASFFMLSFQHNAHGQNAYYDAQIIAQMDVNILKKIDTKNFNEFEKKQLQNLVEFIKKPFSDDTEIPNSIFLWTLLKNNKSTILKKTEQSHELSFFKASKNTEMVNKSKTIPDINWQSSAINALTMVVIQKLEEDVKYFVAEQLFESLIDNSDSDIMYIKALLPRTYAIINDYENFQLNDIGTKWKKSIMKDLNTLPNGVENLIDILLSDPRFSDYHAELEHSKKYLLFAIELGNMFAHGQHISDILNYFTLKYKTPSNSNLYEPIAIINILQKNLRSKDKKVLTPFSDVWISFSELYELNNFNEQVYFSAIVYKQDSKLMESLFATLISNINSNDIYATTSQKRLEVSENFYSILNKNILPYFFILKKLNKQTVSEENKAELYAHSMQISTDFLTKIIKNNIIDKNIENTIKTIKHITTIYKEIYKKEYVQVINTALDIITLYVEKDTIKEKIATLRKFSTLFEGLAKAKNAEEIKDIIDQFVMPPGGYAIKRHRDWTLSISSYVGYFGGIEALPEAGGKGTFATGLSVPIGIDYSVSRYVSIFAGIFDLTAPFVYRVSEEGKDVKELPEDLSFDQVLAPSLALNFHLNDYPIAFSIMAEYLPKVRQINIANPNNTKTQIQMLPEIPLPEILQSKRSYRVGFKISWDLPLFMLGTSID